ncbi:cation diffusion facilitator family transporter [Leptotrichia trevisanii]|uniref:cation diffusion facilitator family transporter n=1 Tax=Leptotrichia trevisanii TaxID=109328 RepID=UPI0026EA1BC9|nr:cation diffusion facilitator family transporter [Leptotrichia trevisanii]
MGSKEFAFELNNEENFEDSFDFDELEEKLQSQLKLELSELEILKENQKQIGDPDNLGKVIEDVIFEQVNNQIAIVAGEDFIKENGGMTLDLRNEAHIQTAENFAKGKIAKHNYKSREKLEKNYERYSNVSHKKFREEYVNPGMDKTLERAGELNKKGIDTVKDIYTGRQISTNTKLENGENNPKSAQREHVKSSSELYKNPSLQMANDNEELAGIINNPENLQGYTTADRNNRKSDKTYDEMDSRDKNKHFEKVNKKSEKFIEKKEKEGEERLKKEGRQTQKEEAFRMGGKALRAVVMQLLASFVKEVIAKLIKWFKTTKGKFEMLWDSLKEAIHSFIGKMKTHLINAGNGLFTTIATAIVGPVFRTLKQVWMLLKQGWQAIKNAIDYIKSPENKNKPIGLLILETGKIVIAGLTAAGAIALSEAIEKGLSSIPILLVEIPLLGSLANIIGIFMGAVVSGIIGAIAINLIQKMIKNKYETQIVDEKIDKSNEILRIQHKIINLNEDRVVETKERVVTNIKERHKNASDYIKDTFNKVFGEKNSTQEKMDEIDSLLEELMR